MRWTIKPKPSEDKIKHLAQALHGRFCGYPISTAGLKLLRRQELLSSFLRPLRSYLMKDMDKAVALKQPLKTENIMVLVITMSMEQPQYHWYLLI
jgi:single-stranded-DNA-specific exonuclease